MPSCPPETPCLLFLEFATYGSTSPPSPQENMLIKNVISSLFLPRLKRTVCTFKKPTAITAIIGCFSILAWLNKGDTKGRVKEMAPDGGAFFRGGSRKEEAGGSKVRRGREVTQVITDLANGPDGGRGGPLGPARSGP